MSGPPTPRSAACEIGALDVTLRDVAIVDRTAGAVDGRLEDVVVPNVGARPLTVASITLSGGGNAVVATTTIPASEATTLIADARGDRSSAHARPR